MRRRLDAREDRAPHELAEPQRAGPSGPLPGAVRDLVDVVLTGTPVADAIVATWPRPDAQRPPTFRDHLDISEVMLAAALVPGAACVEAPSSQRSLRAG